MIASITPFTLLDFPSKLACILWFRECNLLCKYCYNFEFLDFKNQDLREDEVLGFLKERVGFLDGVVLSGGECTIWGERLIALAREIRAMGFEIKLDTNATNPKILSSLLKEGLLDYVALDFKALDSKYKKVCGIKRGSKFKECLELLLRSCVAFEVRSTYHSELLSLSDIEMMRDTLRSWGYRGEYYVQEFVGDKGSLGNLGASKRLQECDGVIRRLSSKKSFDDF